MYDQLQAKAHKLRLFGVYANLERRCAQALSEGLHPGDFLGQILDDEHEARQRAVAKRLATRAQFRAPAELEDWDFSDDRGLSKAKIKELTTLNLYHRKQNLLLHGKTGVGNPMSCALTTEGRLVMF